MWLGPAGSTLVLAFSSAFARVSLGGVLSSLPWRCPPATTAGSVRVTTWNAQFRKLTSSDEPGLIIVWNMHKGGWYEEMVNTRNKSTVADMRWRADGQEICIAYEDGAVIVGSVEGSRLWSRELGASLRATDWSPDGQALLFATTDGRVLLHTRQGLPLGVLALPAVADLAPAPGGGGADATVSLAARLRRRPPPTVSPVPIVTIEWYDGLEGA